MGSGRLLTSDFGRIRALWSALCLASLVFWYLEVLQLLTWRRGTLLIGTLGALTCSEAFLAPRLKHSAGLTMTLVVAEAAVFVGVLWFLAR